MTPIFNMPTPPDRPPGPQPLFSPAAFVQPVPATPAPARRQIRAVNNTPAKKTVPTAPLNKSNKAPTLVNKTQFKNLFNPLHAGYKGYLELGSRLMAEAKQARATTV
jgi:hypothetical protein